MGWVYVTGVIELNGKVPNKEKTEKIMGKQGTTGSGFDTLDYLPCGSEGSLRYNTIRNQVVISGALRNRPDAYMDYIKKWFTSIIHSEVWDVRSGVLLITSSSGRKVVLVYNEKDYNNSSKNKDNYMYAEIIE